MDRASALAHKMNWVFMAESGEQSVCHSVGFSGTGRGGLGSVAGRSGFHLRATTNEPFASSASHRTRAVAGGGPGCVGMTSTISGPNG